jgi:hypothetical protein
MDTFRFGRRLKLPATSSIKHQLRTMMWEDEVNRAEREKQEPKQCTDNGTAQSADHPRPLQ